MYYYLYNRSVNEYIGILLMGFSRRIWYPNTYNQILTLTGFWVGPKYFTDITDGMNNSEYM